QEPVAVPPPAVADRTPAQNRWRRVRTGPQRECASSRVSWSSVSPPYAHSLRAGRCHRCGGAVIFGRFKDPDAEPNSQGADANASAYPVIRRLARVALAIRPDPVPLAIGPLLAVRGGLGV